MGVYFYFNYSITKKQRQTFVFFSCNIETSKTVPSHGGIKAGTDPVWFCNRLLMPELIIEFVCLLLMQLIILIYGA